MGEVELDTLDPLDRLNEGHDGRGEVVAVVRVVKHAAHCPRDTRAMHGIPCLHMYIMPIHLWCVCGAWGISLGMRRTRRSWSSSHGGSGSSMSRSTAIGRRPAGLRRAFAREWPPPSAAASCSSAGGGGGSVAGAKLERGVGNVAKRYAWRLRGGVGWGGGRVGHGRLRHHSSATRRQRVLKDPF